MREDDSNRFVDELREPLVALPHYFGAQIPYDPRSRRLPFGPAVTLVRGSLVRLLRWWLLSALERQDHVNRLLVRAIEQLADDPRPVGCKTMRGPEQFLRIRVGDYRVVYQVNDDQRVLEVLIVRVGHRREVYRFLKE